MVLRSTFKMPAFQSENSLEIHVAALFQSMQQVCWAHSHLTAKNKLNFPDLLYTVDRYKRHRQRRRTATYYTFDRERAFTILTSLRLGSPDVASPREGPSIPCSAMRTGDIRQELDFKEIRHKLHTPKSLQSFLGLPTLAF